MIVLFSVLVLLTTIKILKDTLRVLLEATPPGIDYEVQLSIYLSIYLLNRYSRTHSPSS